MAEAEQEKTWWVNGAIVQRIGELEKKSEKLSKCDVEILIEDTNEVMTVGCAHWHHPSIAVNASYDLLIGETSFGREIKSVKNGKAVSPRKAATPRPPAQQPDSVPTQSQPAVAKKPQPTPDTSTRFREHGTHSRTAEMQATERAKLFMNAIKDGIVVDDEKNKITTITLARLDDLIAHFVNKYWEEEVSARVPKDIWGEIVEDQNPPAVEEPNA
jgi:hypothetical protein